MTAPRVPQALPSVEYLHECFSYAPETGVLTWRERPLEHFSSAHGAVRFNSRCAGHTITAVGTNGYVTVRVDYRLHQAHRICWALHYGQYPTHLIDHINRVKSDNRIDNMRSVSRAGNARNAARWSHNTSGYNGVSWHRQTGKWKAYIKVDGRPHHLGLYIDIADAVAARQRANEQFGFSPRHGQDMVQLPDH